MTKCETCIYYNIKYEWDESIHCGKGIIKYSYPQRKKGCNCIYDQDLKDLYEERTNGN